MSLVTSAATGWSDELLQSLDHGRVLLVTGCSGSRAIPHTILGILVSTLDFNLPLQTALESARFSQEWFPDQISFETPERYPEIVKALNELGHTVVSPKIPLPFQGDAHTIWVKKPIRYVGVAEAFRIDHPALLHQSEARPVRKTYAKAGNRHRKGLQNFGAGRKSRRVGHAGRGQQPIWRNSGSIVGQAGTTSYTGTNATGSGSFFYRLGAE